MSQSIQGGPSIGHLDPRTSPLSRTPRSCRLSSHFFDLYRSAAHQDSGSSIPARSSEAQHGAITPISTYQAPDQEMIEAAHILMSIYNQELIAKCAREAHGAGLSPGPGQCKVTRTKGLKSSDIDLMNLAFGGLSNMMDVQVSLDPRQQTSSVPHNKILSEELTPTKQEMLDTGAYDAWITNDEIYFDNPVLAAVSTPQSMRRQLYAGLGISSDENGSDPTELADSSSPISGDDDSDEYVESEEDWDLSSILSNRQHRRRAPRPRPRRSLIYQSRNTVQNNHVQHYSGPPRSASTPSLSTMPRTPFRDGSVGDDNSEALTIRAAHAGATSTPVTPSVSTVNSCQPLLGLAESASPCIQAPWSEQWLQSNEPPSSTSSMRRFLKDARETMHHRRTESLESFLDKARRKFEAIQSGDEEEQSEFSLGDFIGEQAIGERDGIDIKGDGAAGGQEAYTAHLSMKDSSDREEGEVSEEKVSQNFETTPRATAAMRMRAIQSSEATFLDY